MNDSCYEVGDEITVEDDLEERVMILSTCSTRSDIRLIIYSYLLNE